MKKSHQTSLSNVYSIPLPLLSPKQLVEHKSNLTLEYPNMPNQQQRPKPIILYSLTSTHLHVPRFYGQHHFGTPDQNLLQYGLDVDLQFDGKLWDDPQRDNFHQVPVAEKVLQLMNESNAGGILSLPTGSGKTQMSMHFISSIGKKTLIVVHSQMLMTQWEERLAKALPAARIGHIQGTTCDVENKDVVLAMIQSLAIQNKYPPQAFKDFGFVICDETHVLGAPYFSRAIWKFSHVRYILGLSATPDRKDKMDQVLYLTMGPMLHRASAATNTSRKVSVKFFYFNDGMRKVILRKDKKCNSSVMVTMLTKDTVRNNYLQNIIVDLMSENRSILAFSDRVEHLESMTSWVKHRFPRSRSIHYHAKLDETSRINVDTTKYNWIAATYHLFSAGMDVSCVDTILFMTPRSSVMQTVGRIRNASGPNKPLIIDVVDTFGPFLHQQYSRRRVYHEKEFKLINPNRKRLREEQQEDLDFHTTEQLWP